MKKADQVLRQRIEQDFTYHPPHGDQRERYEEISRQTKELAHRYVDLCPPSRDLSLALTYLEDARMRANKAIAVGEAE